MSKLAMLEAIPYIHPELPPDEKEAIKWALDMLTDIRFKELKSNLKNFDYDVLGAYRLDENEARKILSFIDELQEVEGQGGDGDA